MVPQTGTLFFRSVIEPRWAKSTSGTRLKFQLPEVEEFESYNDRPQMPIYRDDLFNVSWRKESDNREDPLTAQERIRLEREREEFRFLQWLNERAKEGDLPNYGAVRSRLGWGQQRTRNFLMDLSDRGLIQRRKEGKSSIFSLTKPGETRYAELFMTYEEKGEI